MKNEEFRAFAHEFVDWMAEYLDQIEDLPVKSQVNPGDIRNQLPNQPPEMAESMKDIFNDFKNIILPGVTHWQHPSFHAYFNANNSRPSILAEMLTATLGAQCMIWATSPSATELEEVTMKWLKGMLGLPESWHGSIQNGASDATLIALLTARERVTGFKLNSSRSSNRVFRVYGSEQAHSSLDKAVAIAGIGQQNLVKVAVDDQYAMDPEKLREAIQKDIDRGFQPLMVMAAIGTTGSTAIDPLLPIAHVCEEYEIWLHVDAALAGTSLILDEMRWMVQGIEKAESFVVNPHKWMFTNFDCSAYFVKDKKALLRTFSVSPEYLRTKEDEQVNNYRDWGIPLGRRFRALKLWFVIRSFGVEGLRQKIRLHLQLAQWFKERVLRASIFELCAPVPLNTICFRVSPTNKNKLDLDALNKELLESVNATGKIYITHTMLQRRYVLRMVIGQTEVAQRHVEKAWKLLHSTAEELLSRKND